MSRKLHAAFSLHPSLPRIPPCASRCRRVHSSWASLGFTSKKDIAVYSQPLAIGLSTGLCGSITTYASWNQRMAAILAYGLVVRALFGYILGEQSCPKAPLTKWALTSAEARPQPQSSCSPCLEFLNDLWCCKPPATRALSAP